jgi:UDP-N-acetyl-alpha-D-muramoyl-L-alanyl-L-glutamate epimerase
MAGGGKDSAVALELLRQLDRPATVLVLNPIRAAVESAGVAGYAPAAVVGRTIDPTLLALNRRGYLNGHTPFSAYLAFLGVLCAALSNRGHVIVANEAGAGEENVSYLGLPVNHQYSKSLRFERAFRGYCAAHLTPDVEYFSLVRPLHDLQVTALFAGFPAHHRTFRSCNVGQRTDSWCGTCPKCAYVYLSLYPFLPADALRAIFGGDLYDRPEIGHHVRALVGLAGHKPFECVGTREESIMAVALGIRRARRDGRPVPELLRQVDGELRLTASGTLDRAPGWFHDTWGSEHCVPADYLAVVGRAFRRAEVP